MERPNCPKCDQPHPKRNGYARGKQRWRCKGCGFQFTRLTPRGPTLEEQVEVVKLYCSGVSFRQTARLKGIGATTARLWVKDFAENKLPEKPPVDEPVRVVEMDEQWHFLKKKQQTLAVQGGKLSKRNSTRLGGRETGYKNS